MALTDSQEDAIRVIGLVETARELWQNNPFYEEGDELTLVGVSPSGAHVLLPFIRFEATHKTSTGYVALAILDGDHIIWQGDPRAGFKL